MAQTTSCRSLSCRTVSEGTYSECPICGGPVLTSRALRGLGLVLVLVGIGMIALMGNEYSTHYERLIHPGVEAADGSRYTGTPERAAERLDFYRLSIAMGIAALINGLWMVATGRRSFLLLIPFVLILAVLVLVAVDSWLKIQEQPPKIYPTY